MGEAESMRLHGKERKAPCLISEENIFLYKYSDFKKYKYMLIITNETIKEE